MPKSSTRTQKLPSFDALFRQYRRFGVAYFRVVVYPYSPRILDQILSLENSAMPTETAVSGMIMRSARIFAGTGH